MSTMCNTNRTSESENISNNDGGQRSHTHTMHISRDESIIIIATENHNNKTHEPIYSNF